jgi:predicted PurR-regulated permease PerM
MSGVTAASEPEPRPRERTALKWVTLALATGAAVTLAPLWAPLVLAAWFAHLVEPLVQRFQRRVGGRRRIAAWVVIALVFAILVPLLGMLASLALAGAGLIQTITESPEGQSALETLVSREVNGPDDVMQLLDRQHLLGAARQYGGVAWSTLVRLLGTVTAAVVGLFVFIYGSYALLIDGKRAWAWFERHSPIVPAHARRLAAAFHETGRGLVIGTGLTALAQGVLATVTYLLLGVPRGLVLGGLTFFAAFIPSFGTALVWVPVAIGLALTGDVARALILVVVGVFVIGLVDNILRPVLARWGKLDLPVFLLIIAIFGGFAVFDAWGLVLGPLLVRLAVEVLAIAREQGLVGGAPDRDPGAAGEQGG